MMTKPDTNINESEEETKQKLNSSEPEVKTTIYPEVSKRLSGSIIWLGLGFVVMVFLVQQFSGYS